ncbi:related to aryl-alcohol dehydrogenase [Phialocephala subalpina]|uniref:Related to aryl-alcohol dehydrogenase n=1 Tax=Phialocephala subalpina TaxID=576137 RepID=A0A1L7WFP5_9HELO|nr:related to aryl-alcohol dehydrogenase [Phialocephala subalpina]
MSSSIVPPGSTAFLDTEKFDFVVVGGGTSGLVVASRLTEDPNVKVLVLEAGANRLDDPRIVTPGLAASTYDDPDFDWCFMSTPQEHLNGREIAQPKGKVLGGSTAINLGMVIYPSKSGFDGWQQLGNAGWNWETIAPYFRKFHTLTLPSEVAQQDLALKYVDPKLQGTNGPIQLSFGEPDAYTPFNKAWPKTFSTLKHELTGDPISGVANGAFTNPGIVNPVTKARSHAGSDYLSKEVLARPNLRILTEVLVEKILLDKTAVGGISARGVQVTTKDGTRKDILVGEEVVLAAGTIKSPQILELSGIGDSKILKAQGIEVQIDNPNVGENLQDHGYVPFSWEVADDQVSGDVLRNPEIAGAAMAAYQTAQAGPLSGVPIVSAFMPLVDLSKLEMEELLNQYIDEYEYPDFPSQKQQFSIIREMLLNPQDASGQYTMAPFQICPRDGPHCKGIYGMGKEGNYISIVSVLNHPLSRGSVHITSGKPTDQPIIDPRYFSHPLDLELHGRHTQWLETIAATEPMASLLKKDGRRIHADKLVHDLKAAKIAVQECFVSHYHVTSTCSMLPKELGGVVNERLLVYGTRNLRIVDASIFPMIPRGNIQASVYAVAERAADIIKDDHLARGVGKAII